MDKIAKALKKLNDKERTVIKAVLALLLTGKLRGLNIQKLQGHKDIFRVRKGNLRIIYKQKGDDISILAIERRSEKTYRDF